MPWGGIKSSSGTGKVTVDSSTGTASVGNVASADKLSSSRTISLSGDVTGPGSFSGSANLAITTALAGQAFTAGTYTKVTVNSKGIVTGVSNVSASDMPGGIPVSKISGRVMTRIDTAARWASVNPVLMAGELGIESDTHRIKAGDGKTAWTSLPYLSMPADVTVSILPSGSSTWIEVSMENMIVGGTQPTDQNAI